MNARRMIVSVALAASLGLASCGGDDKLSKNELASKADTICQKAETDAKEVKAPSNFSDPDAAATYFDKIVPLAEKQTDDLADLEPADDVKDDWDAVVDKQTDATDLLKSIRDKAKAKDPSGQADLRKLQTSAEAFAAAAKKVGADTCAGS